MEKSHLLIVEDDLDLADMIGSYFRAQNYDVVTAAWGEEALQLAKENPIDLIVLDIHLPDMNGFDLCQKLRESRKTSETPIIFLTSRNDRGGILTGLEMGFVDYITKPFDIHELKLRVRNAINRAKAPVATNAVTDLPEGELLDEKLNQLIKQDEPWAVLHLALDSISRFRERYGFVAADDVLRAVALMIKNAVREHGTPDDFIAHMAADDFVVITQPDKIQAIKERIINRLEQSRDYFYPLQQDTDATRQAQTDYPLRVVAGSVTSSLKFATLAELKDALKSTVS